MSLEDMEDIIVKGEELVVLSIYKVLIYILIGIKG